MAQLPPDMQHAESMPPLPDLDSAAWTLSYRRRTARALVALVRRFAPEFGNKMPLWALQDLWGSPAAGDPLDNDILIGLEAVGELQFFEVTEPANLTVNQRCSCIEQNSGTFDGSPTLLGYVGIPPGENEPPTSYRLAPTGTFAEVIAEMDRQATGDRYYEEAAAEDSDGVFVDVPHDGL